MIHGSRVAVLINPMAARAHHGATQAVALLRKRFQVTFHQPASAAETVRLVGEEADRGCALIVAGGGDGTVNCVVNALAGSNIPLGILPFGTANDFARQLALPLESAAAAMRIVTGKLRVVDVLAVNGRRFCTVGGFGLVAQCAESANRLRTGSLIFRILSRPLGPDVYGLVAIANILRRRPTAERLVLSYVDAEAPAASTLEVQAHGLFVANQRTLGANLTLPAESDNADGSFELCLLEASPRHRLLAALVAMRRGRPLPDGVMSTRRVNRVLISADRDGPFLGDGEILDRGREFNVSVYPAALTVIC